MYPRLVLNSLRHLPASTYLQSSGIKGMHTHAWLLNFLFIYFRICLYLYGCSACMYVS